MRIRTTRTQHAQRTISRCIAPAMIGVLSVSIVSGCGTPMGEMFEPLAEPVRWPPPPEIARIEYLGQITTTEDLKPAKAFGQSLGELLFGEDDTQTMLSPAAVCSDRSGHLYVCDSNAQVLHVFDLENRSYEQWRPTNGAFSQPVCVTVDHTGRILVADSVAAVVFVFDEDGQSIAEYGAGEFSRPCGIVSDPVANVLYVADVAAHQVVVLDMDGRVLKRIGHRGSSLGEFNFPTHIALDSEGRLFVSDSLNFRVQVFDQDHNPVLAIGSKGDLPGYFSQPKGIALDSEDHLYVVDAHFESVQLFDSSGVLLMTFGSEGRGPGQFWLPSGIHIDAQDRIWIADSYNRRVQVMQYMAEVKR